MTIKLRFVSGKEIELTENEMRELREYLGCNLNGLTPITVPQVIPYPVPMYPPVPTYPVYQRDLFPGYTEITCDSGMFS